MKKAVIYARYSSSGQTEQSIEGQVRVCREYAKHNDIFIVDEYIDRAKTGTNDLRPAFQKMIKDSSKRAWEIVLVYKLDRFARDKYDSAVNKHELKKNDVKVISATESIPDSPEAIIYESMLEGIAAYYSLELSQKVKRGQNESYLKGHFTGGYQIFGYDVKDKKNVINEYEAGIVKEVFEKYVKGYTALEIAKMLRERGVRTKRGKYLTNKAVYKMLLNQKYNGKVKHGDTVFDNIYPQIIDDVTWQIVQDKHEENQHAPGRKKEIFDFILSGKLVCGDCGQMMVGISGTSKTGAIHYYYTCLTRTRRSKPCETKTVTKQYLEDIIIHRTWEMLANKNCIHEIAEGIYKMHVNESKQNTSLKVLETQRQTALNATKNLINALEQGIITEQTKIRLKELEMEISKLDYDIEQEKNRSYTYLTVEMIEKYLNTVIYGDIENIDVRKAIIKTFVREIVLYNDKIIITYNFCEQYEKHTITTKTAKEITQKASDKKASLFFDKSSNKFSSCPPSETRLNPEGSSEFFLR